jgi:hypothetical protein
LPKNDWAMGEYGAVSAVMAAAMMCSGDTSEARNSGSAIATAFAALMVLEPVVVVVAMLPSPAVVEGRVPSGGDASEARDDGDTEEEPALATADESWWDLEWVWWLAPAKLSSAATT